MNKKTLSESDICDKFIRPAMERAGWNGMDQIYREYPLRAGRMVVRGRQARRDTTTVLRADYALFYKINIPLAVVEAKDKPFAIPQEWEWCQLVDVAICGPTNGLSPRPVETPTDVKCLSLSATTQGFFRPECFQYVDVPARQVEQFWLKRGDLLIQRGNSLDYVGIAALYDGPDDAYIYPDLMMRLQLSPAVSATYVHMAMVCIEGRNYFKRNATGMQGTMPKVNQATVGGAPLPLPPAAEMFRIVARVESLRRLCAGLRQRLAARQSTQAHLADALIRSATA